VASAHGDVMSKPPPSVSFKKIGTSTMDFELVCVVPDVDLVGRVNSDLNFAIHKRLIDMEPASGTPELLVKGLEGVEQSLGSIAVAVGGGRAVKARVGAATANGKPEEPRRASRRARPVAEEEAEVAGEDAKPPAPAPAPEPSKDDNKE
jgi:potassium efflux system protein